MTQKTLGGCTVCDGDLFEGDALADHHVFKLGELSYIELAHRECGKRGNVHQPGYWNCD